jgi:hypothetical protein
VQPICNRVALLIAWFPLAIPPTLNKGEVITTNQYKIGNWGIVSGSKKDKTAVYGVKVWNGQGVVKNGEIVRVLNWKGQESLVAIGALVKPVAETVETKGYGLYKLATKAKK